MEFKSLKKYRDQLPASAPVRNSLSGCLFFFISRVALWFRAKETLKTNKVLAGTLHYEITEKNIHVSQGKESWGYGVAGNL